MAPLSPRPEPASLDGSSRDLLVRLGEQEWGRDFYLAGSAGLACYLEHRPVRDLDLMGATNRLTSPERRDLLQDLLAIDAGVRVETARDGFLYVRFPASEPSDGRAPAKASGPAVRMFYYPYPLIDPEEEVHGFALASALDLGLMKLGAIISRASRRDFVDLYLLCQRLPLADILERSPEKFGHVRDFPLQALKGLADRTLLDGAPMPRLSQPLEWPAVDAWLAGEVRDVARQFVGLPG